MIHQLLRGGGGRPAKYRKLISTLMVFIFAFERLVLASVPALVVEQQAFVERQLDAEPEHDIVKATDSLSKRAKEGADTALEFLEQTLSLTQGQLPQRRHETDVDSAGRNELAVSVSDQVEMTMKNLPSFNDGYESERYDFNEALDFLRPEYAAAVIIHHLSADDLKALTGLSFEVGVAVLRGQLVLFTSGNQDEIFVNGPALEILQQASFVFHTHLAGGLSGPSLVDYQNAGERTEYVVTSQNTFSYDRDGLIAASEGHEECLLAMQKALGAQDHQLSASVEARRFLNEFVADMDKLNRTATKEKIPFRSDGTSLTLEAEAMTVSGGTWNGGDYVLMWGSGEVSKDYDIQESGIYEIEIKALGDPQGKADLPQLQFLLDGEMTNAPMDAGNNNWQFTGYRLTGIELTSGQHRFGVGAYRTVDGQYIAVDKIVLRKTGEIPYWSKRLQVEAESMTGKGGTWNGGSYVIMWGNGEVSSDYDIQESGIYEVEMIALGDPRGKAELPQMKFLVDDDMTGGPIDAGNNNWHFASYRQTGIELTAGRHRLGVGVYLTTDGQYIALDRIVLRKIGEIQYPSARLQVEAEAMTASGGTWNGGAYTLMWGSGTLMQTAAISEPGRYTIEVAAAAELAGWPTCPELSLRVDGVSLGQPIVVANNHYTFRYFNMGDLELNAGRHTFQLAFAGGSAGQAIAINRFTIRKISQPVIEFTSAPNTTASDYLLSYLVGGVNYQEHWTLQNGRNDLLVSIPLSEGSVIRGRYSVQSLQADSALPDMPAVPAADDNSLNVIVRNGLNLQYQHGLLFAVESPGIYKLYLPETDENGNLSGGLLVFQNGDRLLYENSKAVYRLNTDGSKLIYDFEGRVTMFIDTDGSTIRFDYQTDESGNVLSVLSLEESAASLYDAEGLPLWIVKKDGSEICYENGRLMQYKDDSGNLFNYLVTPILSGSNVTGYHSEISSIFVSALGKTITLPEALSEPSSFPSVTRTLNAQILKVIDYDHQGKIQKTISGAGEVLQLSDGLPMAFTDQSGQIYSINALRAANGEVASLSVVTNIIEQVYDEAGALTAIRLCDGTLLLMDQLKLDQVELADGSWIKDISWNSTQTLTGFTHVYPDGRQETYQDGHLIRSLDQAGNLTSYVFENGRDRLRQIVTQDGRTYQVTEVENAQGLTDRISRLRKLDLPDGSKITFEPGQPVRYIQKKQVTLAAEDVPVLPAGEAYLPSLSFGNLELRSVTIDPAGNILSGEILFNDGTQYLIQNGEILKQITPAGQIFEFKEALPAGFQAPAPVLPVPLTPAERAFRDQLLEKQLDYFVNGIGLDSLTGLPVDSYSQAGGGATYSQATLVGFWAEILATVARGDYDTPKMNCAEALQKLKALLKNFREVQMQAGWNGLVAFFNMGHKQIDILDASGKATGQKQTVPVYTPAFGSIGIGDNLNLGVSLSAVIGALSSLVVDPGLSSLRDEIVATANQILSAQDAGYASFYDPLAQRFRMSYVFKTDTAAGHYEGYMDRVFNEFRTGLFWLAARNPAYLPAVQRLDVAVRPYETQGGDTIDNAVPFDGGAFQMFWPLIHVDETQYPEFDTALRNFLCTQADYAHKTGTPGLLSAGERPGEGYEGKIGVPEAAETDDPLHADIGSIYGTASAFALAPHYSLQFLKTLLENFPEIQTSTGFVDALSLKTEVRPDPGTGLMTAVREPVVSDRYFGVDQAAFILSLLKTSQNYFSSYLQQTGKAATFDAIYRSFSFGLAPSDQPIPLPPAFNTEVSTLYDGPETYPDGQGYALTKQPAFVSGITDPELGEGFLYNYWTPDGWLHHAEIEFENGQNLRRMNLQAYLLLPGRQEISRSVFEAVVFDLLDEAIQSGAFYTPGQGFADNSLNINSEIGEVSQLKFDFRELAKPVGIWAQYDSLDLSRYDYLSVPLRLDARSSSGIRLKFEFKGIGEIYLTPSLTGEWQYVQIPLLHSGGKLSEIAITVQSTDGAPVQGAVLLGPLSAFKGRTSNHLDWLSLTGKSAAEMQTLLKQKALTRPGEGVSVEREEVLEGFILDSDGRLVSGTLKSADGSMQYFRNGKLAKWIFPNGRTIVFTGGLADFMIDLSRGKLTESKYYYDKTFRGEIESMIVQDNDRKRIYDRDGNLQQIIEGGHYINFKNGQIDSIVTETATLSGLVFGDDGSLLSAHIAESDGRAFDFNSSTEQMVMRSNGVKVYTRGNRITAIETPENGQSTFTYNLNAGGQLLGIDVSFAEITSGVSVPKTLSLFDYLQRPERGLEKSEILQAPPVGILADSSIGGFSVGPLPSGEQTYALSGDGGYDSEAWYQFKYNSASGPILGMAVSQTPPVPISSYDFIQITLQEAPAMSWAQDFNLRLKTSQQATLYTFTLDKTPYQYKTYAFPLNGKIGSEGQVTLEVIREAAGVGQIGSVYIKDISYLAIRKIDRPLWEDEAGITASEISNFWNEGKILSAVGAEIANGQPLVYEDLKSFLDLPTDIVYHEASSGAGAGEGLSSTVSSFRTLDGTCVELSEGNVKRLILPDGTINEYSAQGNSAQGIVAGSAGWEPGHLNYNYGALRKITQADGRVFEFSYEFDDEGKPTTVVRDDLTGDIRRFKDGKLLQSVSANGVSTRYDYENGQMIGAELMYKNHFLQGTRYEFAGDETQVTDDQGTTWYYDADGNLTKHLTRDGYLYAYSDYSAVTENTAGTERDYKWVNVFSAAALRAVTLAGYEAEDGTQIKEADNHLIEIDLPSGDKAVNVVLDENQKIKSGQIQFKNGWIVVIENYLPVSGRLADKTAFNSGIPVGSTRTEIIQDSTGAIMGSRFEIDGADYRYDAYGNLKKIEEANGESYQFDYQTDGSGKPLSYDVLHRKQTDFKGVPFPKELIFMAGSNLTLRDPNAVLVQREGGSGFLIGSYDEALDQWKVLSGQFASDGDRILLRNFLKDLKTGQYVAMAVSDPAFSKAGEEILSLVEGIGGGDVRQASAANQNWYLFGNEFLKKGEGTEKCGGNVFSTVAEDAARVSLSGVTNPVFKGIDMFLEVPKEVAEAYSGFLQTYERHKPNEGLQSLAVYNQQNELVYSEQLNGIRTFYEQGKPRETFAADGELLYVHEYGCPEGGCPDSQDPYLAKVTLVKARRDFESEVAKSHAQIEQIKFDALEQLARQEEVAQADIRQQVAEGLAALDAYIRQLEAARYQDVKVCKKVLFWKRCSHYTVEVPGVADKINETRNQKVELLQKIQPEQIATIPALIAQKKQAIEDETAQKMAELTAQEQSVLHDILQREMAPVLSDIYRRLLGRDPSAEELEAEILRTNSSDTINLNRTVTEINASSELRQRTADKTAIIGRVRAFLDEYLTAAEDSGRQIQLLQFLQIDPAEVVDLSAEDVQDIMVWLEKRDLHFGQSAFLSLVNLLASRGIAADPVVLGGESILVDILTGTIHRFSEGELLISAFALERVAKIHGASLSGVAYTFEDLKTLYASANGPLRVIAHTGGNHYVVVTSVTAERVTFFESNKGPEGALFTETVEQFMKSWDCGNGNGHLVLFEDQAVAAKILDDKTAMKIRGAFFGIDDLIFWFTVASIALTVTSIVVSFISPVLGKMIGYAAMVAGIIGIAASVVNFAVQGFRMALSAVTSYGVVGAVKQGFTAIGSAVWNGVAHVGQFLQQGFKFVKDVFTGSLSGLGAGITNMKNFAVDGIKIMFDPAGALVPQKLTFAQTAGRSLISAAINVPVSKGLEGLGVDPAFSRLAGAFVSGGVVGLGGGMSGFLRSGIQMYALQGVSELGLHLNLPPPITSAINLAVSTSLTDYFDPSFNLKKELPKIFPTFTRQLTLGGLELLGRSMGLDWRMAELIGLPLAAAVGGITQDLLSPNGGIDSLWEAIQTAVLKRETAGGVLALGASFVVHRLGIDQSLLGSLSSRVVAGMFNDFLASAGRFSVVDSLIKATDRSFYQFFDPVLLPQLYAAVKEHGLADGIEQYATMLFTAETINELTAAGVTFGQWILNGLPNAENIVYQGESAKRLSLTQNGKTISFIFIPDGNKMELQAIYERYSNGREPRGVQFVTDDEGKITQALVTEQMTDGTFRQDVLTPGGEAREVFFRDWNGETYARLSFNAGGDLEFINYSLGISDHLSPDGRLNFNFTAAPDLQDLNQVLYDFNTNLSPEDTLQLASFTYGNGFWNSHQPPDGVPPLMANFMNDVAADAGRNGSPGMVLFDENGNIAHDSRGNILTTASLPVTLYAETGLVGNVLRWTAETWFGARFMRDEIENELKHYLDLLQLNQDRFGLDSDMPLVHFSHSGDFQPLIQALEHMPDEYRSQIKTVVAYGAPYVGDGIIDDPYLETLIRVRGTQDNVPFQGARQFQIVNENASVIPVPNQYNIEIIEAKHSDFSCASGPNHDTCTGFINQQTNLFMRDLQLQAANVSRLDLFLKTNTTDGIIYDDKTKVITVNPLMYKSPFGNRS